MNQLMRRRLISILCASGLLSASEQVMASAFQIWEQDGASIGNYHAGYAAAAADASTAFYNPAGITLIKNQQIVIGGAAVLPDIQYKGTVAINTINNFMPYYVTAQGGTFAFVPSLHYVAPLTDRMGFGFSVDVPFGAEVNYGSDTYLRYISTLATIKVVDVSPSLGFQVTDKASVGLGPDFQKMDLEFDQVAVLSDPTIGDPTDTKSINRASDTAWGYHLGGLYQFTPDTRVGLSYHSQVVHHLSKKSTFSGPLANELNNGEDFVSRATSNITLPPYTALSFYHRLNSKVALMASAIFTQWTTVKNIIMKNLAGIDQSELSGDITVVAPQSFRNSWNFSMGADYFVTDQMTLKGGVGYDQTPVRNAYRTVQLPDNNRIVIALGGHYQATKAIGIDLNWSHFFMNKAHVIPPTQVTGDQEGQTNGSVTGGADVFGGQVTWDIA